MPDTSAGASAQTRRVDEAQLLRTARRRVGLSQRALAEQAGVSASTVAALEAGRRSASMATVARLLDVAGLELAVQARTPAACVHLQRHLRRTLVERLYLAVGGVVHPVRDRTHATWWALWSLTAHGRVEVVGEAAVGVWVPVVAERLVVRLLPFRATGAMEAPPAVTVLPATEPPRPGLVPIGLLGRIVTVASPDLLALQPVPAEQAVGLRAAAALLHEQGPVDDALRRPPAHRDAQPRKDDHKIWHTKAFAHRPIPEPADRRGWQLDGQASLAQWLRVRGYPT